MNATSKLRAALTTTGFVLSLALPSATAAPAAPTADTNTSQAETLAQRAERLKVRARAIADPARHGVIENIVQFFNFRNR
jgi:hypothetical protein